MKIKLSKRPLPGCFSSHRHARGIVLERDIRPYQSSLRAKLLVFDTMASLRRFWKLALDGDPGGRTCGCVTRLCIQHTRFYKDGSERSWMEYDPRYFCVIGLLRRYLTMRNIAHEAAHAGFAYAKRRGRYALNVKGPLDEERVAYPTGDMTAEIVLALKRGGLIE